MFDQIKTEPMQFYQQQPMTNVNTSHMTHQQQVTAAILQHAQNQRHPNNIQQQQQTAIMIHENKNRTHHTKLNIVSWTFSKKIWVLSISFHVHSLQPQQINENLMSNLVDIKSEIINSSSSSSSSQGHQPFHRNTTASLQPQPHRIIQTTSSPPADSHHTPAMSRANSTSSTRSNSSKPQACKVCGKVLSSPSSYYVHMKLHSGAKPFQCTILWIFTICTALFINELLSQLIRYSLRSCILS